MTTWDLDHARSGGAESQEKMKTTLGAYIYILQICQSVWIWTYMYTYTYTYTYTNTSAYMYKSLHLYMTYTCTWAESKWFTRVNPPKCPSREPHKTKSVTTAHQLRRQGNMIEEQRVNNKESVTPWKPGGGSRNPWVNAKSTTKSPSRDPNETPEKPQRNPKTNPK